MVPSLEVGLSEKVNMRPPYYFVCRTSSSVIRTIIITVDLFEMCNNTNHHFEVTSNYSWSFPKFFKLRYI
jgi:hypothetical protein